MQASLDEMEPLTWLKHLLDRRGTNSKARLPWNLSALIVEEYAKSQIRSDVMETIHEDSAAASPMSQYQSPTAIPSLVRSPPSSHNSYRPSTDRWPSYDGQVSFEPYLESTRTSLEGDSRKIGDGHLRAWRHSLPGVTNSPHSSIDSSNPSPYSSPHRQDLGPSLSNSRLHIRDIAKRMRRRPYESEDGSESARNSFSEDQSRSDEGPSKRKKAKRGSRPPDLTFTSVNDESKRTAAVRSLPTSEAGDSPDPEANQKVHSTLSTHNTRLSDDGQPTAVIRPDSQSEPSAELDVTTPRAGPIRKGVRLSLPPRSLHEEDRHHHQLHHYQHEADEEQEQNQYEIKSQYVCESLVISLVY